MLELILGKTKVDDKSFLNYEMINQIEKKNSSIVATTSD